MPTRTELVLFLFGNHSCRYFPGRHTPVRPRLRPFGRNFSYCDCTYPNIEFSFKSDGLCSKCLLEGIFRNDLLPPSPFFLFFSLHHGSSEGGHRPPQPLFRDLPMGILSRWQLFLSQPILRPGDLNLGLRLRLALEFSRPRSLFWNLTERDWTHLEPEWKSLVLASNQDRCDPRTRTSYSRISAKFQ